MPTVRGSALATLLALVAVGVVGCSAASDPRSTALSNPPTSSPSPTASTVIGRWTSDAVSGAPNIATAERLGEFQLSFENEGGEIALVAHGPFNIASVPVSIRGNAITPDPSRQTSSAVGCLGGDASPCDLDNWLAGFIAQPLQMRLRGDALRLTHGQVEVDLRRDVGHASRIEVNRRILLTYQATGTGGDQALLRGVLTINPAGCIAVDDRVLIAPSTTTLHPDGSITLAGAKLKFGSAVRLGGGTTGRVPDGSPCHETGDHYFTVANYPQPQS